MKSVFGVHTYININSNTEPMHENDISYKIRGAYHKISSLTGEELEQGVVCASAGNHAQGVAFSCKAKKIKVIRPQKDGSEPKVYNLDLSTIDGLQGGMMVMQANDIVYVTPRWRVATDLLREVTPILSLITTTTLLIVTVGRVNGN